MTDEAISPLRRRMIEDMTIRKLASKTQRDYVQRVKDFAAFLGRSPDTARFEDVRRGTTCEWPASETLHNSGHRGYSMISSARRSNDSGIVKQSALAVVRLMTKSTGLSVHRFSPA